MKLKLLRPTQSWAVVSVFFYSIFCIWHNIKQATGCLLFVLLIAVNVRGQAIPIAGNQYHLYGPNSTWSEYFQVGGNGQATNYAFVAVTNGNLHLDAKPGFATYINYYNHGNTFINAQGGNVGIGTTDPATKFEVRQIASGWTMNSRVVAGMPGEINGLKFYSGYIGDDKWAGIASVAEDLHSNSTGFSIYTNQTEKLRITADGNVGIGTFTPCEKLEVNGNAYFQRLRSGNAVFNNNSRNSLNSFNTGQDASLSTGWIATDFGGNDNASDRLVVGTGFGGKAVIGTHNYNLTAWGGDLLINPTGGGNVAIGTTAAKEKLSVNGKIRAKEIKVDANNWPDYVFEEGYKVGTLAALESYIKENKHLPDMPSAKEVETNGIALGEMNKLLLKKVEELTLHLIEKDKNTLKQEQLLKTQAKQLSIFEARLKRLENFKRHNK